MSTLGRVWLVAPITSEARGRDSAVSWERRTEFRLELTEFASPVRQRYGHIQWNAEMLVRNSKERMIDRFTWESSTYR